MYIKMSYQSRAFIPKTPFLLSCIKAEYFLRLLVYFIYFTVRLGKTKAKRGKVTPCNISFLKCSVFLLGRNDGEVLQKLAEIFRYFMVGITILVAELNEILVIYAVLGSDYFILLFPKEGIFSYFTLREVMIKMFSHPNVISFEFICFISYIY